MHTAYLLMGGNIGNREEYLQKATGEISRMAGRIVKKSALYETAAWGNTSQGPFLNQALEIETTLEPAELMTTLLLIEEKIGRVRMERYGPRIIDIDILLYGNEVIKSSHITVPHKRLADRRFALEPLNELASDVIHPVLNKSVHKLLLDCKDPLPVQKLTL